VQKRIQSPNFFLYDESASRKALGSHCMDSSGFSSFSSQSFKRFQQHLLVII